MGRTLKSQGARPDERAWELQLAAALRHLRRQRPRVRDPTRHPAVELPHRADARIVHAQPSVHGPSPHLEPTNMRTASEAIRLRRLHSNQQASLTARAHRHVSVHKKREPTKHSLLRDSALLGDKLPNAVGKTIVERHGHSVPVSSNARADCRMDQRRAKQSFEAWPGVTRSEDEPGCELAPRTEVPIWVAGGRWSRTERRNDPTKVRCAGSACRVADSLGGCGVDWRGSRLACEHEQGDTRDQNP